MTGFQQAVEGDQPTAQEVSFDPAATAPKDQQPQVTMVEDGSIVVNGKVFRPEAAAKKIEHADNHIKTLEQENAEKDAAALKLLDRIEALEASRNQTDALDKLVREAAKPPVLPTEQPSTPGVSSEELAQVAANTALSTLKAEQEAAREEANLNECTSLAQAAFGDAYGLKIDEAGLRYNMTVDQVMDMARRQPAVFKTLFIPEGTKSVKPDTTSSTLGGNVGQDAQGVQRPAKSYLRMSAKERKAEFDRRMAALNTGE